MLEGCMGFGEQWSRIIRAALSGEPFGMLELGHGEVENEAELAKEARGCAKTFVDPLLVAKGLVKPPAKPRRICFQKRS